MKKWINNIYSKAIAIGLSWSTLIFLYSLSSHFFSPAPSFFSSVSILLDSLCLFGGFIWFVRLMACFSHYPRHASKKKSTLFHLHSVFLPTQKKMHTNHLLLIGEFNLYGASNGYSCRQSNKMDSNFCEFYE